MKDVSKKALLSLLMVLVLLFTVTGCGSKTDTNTDTSDGGDTAVSGKSFVNTLPPLQVTSGDIPEFTELVKEKHELNSDTVGWLHVPNTKISDVVVWYPDDVNDFYYRRNFEKEYYKNGILYADYRCTFGEGNPDDFATNTCIYGHTMSADIDGVMFAPLKYFEDEEFAKKTPYIYFSTMEEDLAWEVFAVFYATTALPYNRPDLSPEEWEETLNECIKRSIYTYDTQVSATDKVIGLSTCTYSVPGKGAVSYPNEYRYVVMAKLVDKSEATKTTAEFELNPEPKEP